MPVDMTGRGRHHVKTSPPPQMQPVQPNALLKEEASPPAPDDRQTGPFEWQCPACDTKQISRPEQGCTNPACPTRQTAAAPAAPIPVPGMTFHLDEADRTDSPPSPEYRLLEVISPIGADNIFRPPGVHQLDDQSVVTILAIDDDADNGITTYRELKEQLLALKEQPTEIPSFEPDERAVIEYGLAALEGQIEKVKTTSYGGQVITEETLTRLRARLGEEK